MSFPRAKNITLSLACLLSLVMLGAQANTPALTIDSQSVTLSTDQRASLKRFLATALPDAPLDWNSLSAYAATIGRKRQPLAVSISTLPTLTAAGFCRMEQHRFSQEAGNGQWRANDELTSRYAWTAQGGQCAMPTSPIGVGKSISDTDFLFIEQQRDALRSRAAQVIGGSDCARVRYCEVTLSRINRLREDDPQRPSRTITRLTFSPLKPGPECLYVMELSFVGPLKELMPLGASCPKP